MRLLIWDKLNIWKMLCVNKLKEEFHWDDAAMKDIFATPF